MNLINPDLNRTYPHCRFRVSDKLKTLEHWLCDYFEHAMDLFGPVRKLKQRYVTTEELLKATFILKQSYTTTAQIHKKQGYAITVQVRKYTVRVLKYCTSMFTSSKIYVTTGEQNQQRAK